VLIQNKKKEKEKFEQEINVYVQSIEENNAAQQLR